MNALATSRLLAACFSLCAASLAIAADNPFAAFKGKMKPGLYDYKMEMDMGQVPGMPPGMGKQNMNFQQCITEADIDKGAMGKGRDGKGMPENCKVENFRMSGNTASYTMICAAPQDMRADNVITFAGDNFTMNMKMAMNHGGQKMNMTQKMEGRLLGPCK